jgi:hypothetical protein
MKPRMPVSMSTADAMMESVARSTWLVWSTQPLLTIMEEILVRAIAPMAIASNTGADVPDTTFDLVERFLNENIFSRPL